MRKLVLTTAATCLWAGMSLAQAGNPGLHMIEQWDTDADGQITIEEARTKRGEIFYMFDAGSDGVLSAEDWAGVAEHMAAEMGEKGQGQGQGQGHGKGRGPGAIMQNAMGAEFNDANADGQVTLEEFTAATDTLFAALDMNGDKVVTTDDFGQN